MLSEFRNIKNGINRTIQEIEFLNQKKESLVQGIKTLNEQYTQNLLTKEEYKRKVKEVLKNKEEQRQLDTINKDIEKKLEDINKRISELPSIFDISTSSATYTQSEVEEARKFVKSLKKRDKTIELEKFTTYEPSKFGKFANSIFQAYTKQIVKKYPHFFNELNIKLRLANIQIFSSTYLSIAILSSLASILLTFIIFFLLFLPKTFMGYFSLIIFSLVMPFLVFTGFYLYPQLIIGSRARAIKNEIPFALIHMSAVAGSGARLIDMFAMLLETKEYPALSREVKRLINYVNLLGYNLTTALKAVSQDTPSEEFRETLNGLASTIETGGDLKQYLRDKANDSLNTYRLTRKKYVDTVATYSEIYTAILIVAPLLFLIILAIISGIGQGEIAGVSIDAMQKIGIFFLLPLLNIGFLIFVRIVQPEL